MKPTYCLFFSHRDGVISTRDLDTYRAARNRADEILAAGALYCDLALDGGGTLHACCPARDAIGFIAALATANIPPSIALEGIRQAARYHQIEKAPAV